MNKTQKYKAPIFFIINALVLGGLWLWLAYNTHYPIEIMEVELYSILPVNWIIIPFISRILLGLIFFMGISILFFINKRWVIILLIVFTTLLVIDILFFQSSTSFYLGIFKIPGPFENYIYTILLLIFSIIYIYTPNTYRMYSWLSKVIHVLAILVIFMPFIFNPIYPQDFKDEALITKENSIQKDSLLIKFPEIKSNNSPVLYAFFSVSCGYCKIASRKLQESIKKNENYIPVKIIYWGNDQLIHEFQEKTHNYIPYMKVEDESYAHIAGYRYPCFKLIQGDSLLKSWAGAQFNYRVYENLKYYAIK